MNLGQFSIFIPKFKASAFKNNQLIRGDNLNASNLDVYGSNSNFCLMFLLSWLQMVNFAILNYKNLFFLLF